MRNENDFSICSTVSQVKKQLKNINAIERCHCHSMSFFQCHSILCEYHGWQGKCVIAIWKVLLYKIKTQPFTVVFYQISVLKFSQNSQKNTCCGVIFQWRFKSCSFTKKEFHPRLFPVDFKRFFRNQDILLLVYIFTS